MEQGNCGVIPLITCKRPNASANMLWMVPPARVTSFISTTTPSLCPSRSLLSSRNPTSNYLSNRCECRLIPFLPSSYLYVGLHLIAYHKFFASQVIGPSVWPILSTKVLANLNKGSPPHRPTNHFPIIPRRKPLVSSLSAPILSKYLTLVS